MDSGYNSIEIWPRSISLVHKPIIDVKSHSLTNMQEELKLEKNAWRTLGLVLPEEHRYARRTTAERLNGGLKDEFGGRHVQMFGLTALVISQPMQLVVPPI